MQILIYVNESSLRHVVHVAAAAAESTAGFVAATMVAACPLNFVLSSSSAASAVGMAIEMAKVTLFL